MRSVYIREWRIDLTVRDGVQSAVSAARVARTAAAGLDAAGAPVPASIGVILTDDAEITTLNEQHMGHEGATDVLSFPLLPAQAFPPHPGQRIRQSLVKPFVLPPRQRQHLGDVVISVERAAQQAAAGQGGQTGDVRWSVTDELRLLVVHGVLHICGWDHADADERDAMRALEKELLAET